VGAGLEIDCGMLCQKISNLSLRQGNSNAVAEHTLGMILSLFNKLNVADREIRSGHWNRESNRGHELDGKRLES
jgi:D-3-phosphoglycerate dehydrogenase